jgi:hypothetical protein
MRWWVLAAAVTLVEPGHAAERARSLVKSGDWAAVERAGADSGFSKICLAIDATAGVAFQADTAGIQFLVGNPHWDLPETVNLEVKVVTDQETKSFPITSNTTNIVSAKLDPSMLASLLADMEKTTSMLVTVGEIARLQTSLAGSTVVLNAFMACTSSAQSSARFKSGSP